MEAAGAADEPACGGCHKTLESASGGVVVAFGNALWHVECFRCAKCRTTVSADTNLLLLADGSPVCQACSYSCHVCHNPILDEAIMTGDDSYHAACFKCRSCSRRIEELVFAKTSQGIYCMSCHNDRVARSRRHAEQKKRSRTRSRKEDSHAPSPAAQSPTPSLPSRRHPTEPNQTSSPAPLSSSPSPALLSANHNQQDLGKRRKSYDDGVRPLSSFFAMGPGVSTVRSPSTGGSFAVQQQATINPNGGLNIPTANTPTSRADKRRSINPSLVMPPPATGDGVGAPLDERGQLSPYSVDGSRATSPSRDVFELPTRNGLIDTRTGSIDMHAPGVVPDDAISILGPNEGEITMMFEEPTFTLDGSSLDEPALTMMMGLEDDEPTVDVRRPHINGNGDARSTSPARLRAASPGISRSASPSPANGPSASPANLGRSTSPLERSASPNGRRTSPSSGLGDGRIGRSASPGIGRSKSLSPASVYDQPSNANGGTGPAAGRSTSPLVVKSASQGSAVARTASPAPGTRNASPAPGSRVVAKSASQGATNGGIRGPLSKGSNGSEARPTPTRSRSGARESMPPPAVPPKDKAQEIGMHHQHALSYSGLGGFGSTSGTATPSGASVASSTPNVSAVSNPTPRPTHPRSSSSSSSSPVIDHASTTATATYGAMQLPPMRFSLSDTDFADLLKGVGVDSNGKLRLSLIGRGSMDLKDKEKEKEDDMPAGPTVKLVSEQEPEPLTVKLVQEDKRRPGVDTNKQPNLGQESAKKSSSDSTKLRSSPDSDRRRPSTEHDRTPTPASEPFPRLSSETRPSISSITVPESATASVLEEDEDDFGQTTTLATPVIRTTLAPPSSGFRERADSITQNDAIVKRLKDMAESAQERGSNNVKISLEFLDTLTKAVIGSQDKYSDLKGRYDGMKRTSQQFIDGLSVAQSEYDKELAARRDAEAEVTRLRVQLSGQAARLTAMSAENRIREVSERQAADANMSLRTLLGEVAMLKAERDMIIVEVDELGKKTGGSLEPLEARLEGVRKQYRKDLEGLKLQREGLVKEITELKEHRDIFLEETTALNARNEELAELNAQIQRQVEQQMGSARPSMSRMDSSGIVPTQLSLGSSLKEFGAKPRPSLGAISAPSASVSSMATTASVMSSVTATTSALSINEEKEREKEEIKVVRVEPAAKGGFKWLKPKVPAKEANVSTISSVSSRGQQDRPKGLREHNFVQQSVLRFARCDQCGDKMWGMQMRCSNCPMACHHRCVYAVKPSCHGLSGPDDEPVVDISPLPPSMFGRDLVEQVRADAKGDPSRMVPVIVDKCIRAVEALAMDYEGIYRKTGGSSQSKAITQLFERGNYDAFDLEDTDSFNDISSVTSVMKTYFRQLPNPLLTFALHEKFVEAAGLRDANAKHEALVSLVHQLPPEHYHTLRYLMLHLSRVKDCSEENLMNARNIGVVFGPTLMRSADPSREFGDMAGKALTVEWLVENAPTVFSDPSPI
ncbi:Rho-type GTPase-activating protein 4 [Ceratobasidium sp. AG-Ba]|nr:Rho-type GTPase-activating protein 4 [Ceratobasidium sp. AG-Ba]